MDDIYDDLDNYDDVNALQELRSENQVLKQKVEEYTASMGKLQKDYDDLALEFKKLEMNYSSLLKTARAEIERKTQIITNLNIEKDMMVLKSLQNGHNIRRSFYKSKPNMNNVSNVDKKQENDKKIEECKKKNVDCLSDRKERSCIQSQEPVTVPHSENINKISNSNLVNTTEKNSDSKENVKHKQNTTTTSNNVASSIKNRRKSMPTVCVQKKLSSDDECERQSTSKDIIRNVTPTNSKPERKQLDRAFIDRTSSNKTSESSSIDDKNSNYQERSRDILRNKPQRYYDDKYRSRDKYEIPQRHRRHNSPDRSLRRLPREYHDDYHYKSEHGRHRVLVSPTPDPYHASNYHQRRNQDHRPNNDGYPNEYDRQRNRYKENQPYKHRLSSNHDEPASKRQKIELFSSTGHLYPDKEEIYTEMELMDRVPGLGHTLGMQDTSCQSPDYLHTDEMAHPVKEIMNTSAIPLEDPRKCSNKYVLKTDAEGVTTMSTVAGRNIDIIPIDKTAWNIERVDIPQALTNHPSQYNDELVNEIYMGIDNPVANMSMESGELCLYSENYSMNNETGNKKETSDLKKPTEEYSNPSECIRMNVEKNQPPGSTKYKIPKITHDSVKENQKSVKLESHKIICESREEGGNKQEYNSDYRKKDLKLESRHNKMTSHKETQDQSQMTLCAKVNVEGDLELSDENSDVEPNKSPAIAITVFQAPENKSTDVGVAPSNMNENESRELRNNLGDFNQQEINMSAEKVKQSDCKKHENKKKYTEVVVAPSNINKIDSKNLPDNLGNFNLHLEVNASTEKTKDTIGKKHKSKKKSKHKDSKQAVHSTEIHQLPNKKVKLRKDKVNPKVTDSKFSDLFGDSGSLIMPEDLGLATYVPTLEDTQDAVDLNIKQINKQESHNVNEVCNGNITKAENKGTPESATKYHEIVKNIESHKVKNIDTQEFINEQNMRLNNEKGPSEPTPNVVYENLNSNNIDNSNIVKTVVISTGVQPQFDIEGNVQPVLEQPNICMETNKNVIPEATQSLATNEFKRRECMKALATSTPQKAFGILMETENRVASNPESSFSRAGSIDSTPSAVDQSDTNTLNSNADVPDVRIFVKRRRKIIKKPPAM